MFYNKMSVEELKEVIEEEQSRFNGFVSRGYSINMARGKPSAPQLDLSDNLLNLTRADTGVKDLSGSDCRNYGLLTGIEECRSLFGELMGVDKKNVVACGSSSLNLMYDYISQCCTHGTAGETPWMLVPDRKFIAVVPGYDRHFAIAEHFGLQMINVPIGEDGPDMDKIEEIIKDPSVKGMFCVPKYSNPDGITYSEQTVERIAAMKPAAKDFRVIWDEAYIIHDLYDDCDELANIFELSKKYGNEDNFIAFSSTSKITFAGAGVSALAASDNNIKEILARLTLQIISYDKINQLRHCALYKNLEDLKAQMKKHAAILRPKFDTVLSILSEELNGTGIAHWVSPKGGYFISLYVTGGSAKTVGALCKEAGVTLTNVGASYPYGIDPDDANIRIAPSCPSVEELEIAARILCCSVKLVSAKNALEKLTGGKK